MTKTLEAMALALVEAKRQGRGGTPVEACKSKANTESTPSAGSPWSELLRGMPPEARYTTLNDKKQPINPSTGKLNNAWNLTGYTVEELEQVHSNHVKAVGLMVGVLSEGIAAVDFDGPGSEETFRHHMGHDVQELPLTTTWSSGLPGRYQAAYRVPRDWWGRLSMKQLSLNGHSNFELRWNHQSGIAGTHPNWFDPGAKSGFGLGSGTGRYEFVNRPGDVGIAEAPEWLLEAWAALSNPGASAYQPKGHNGFLSAKGRESLKPSMTDALYDSYKAEVILTQYLQPANAHQGYEVWNMVGMVLRYISFELDDPDKLFPLWDEWSSQQDVYDGTEPLYKKWKSYQRTGDNTEKLGTLVEYAKDYGYKKPPLNKNEYMAALPKDVQKELGIDGQAEIQKWIDTLYALEKANAEWSAIQAARAELYRRMINKTEVDRRLLEMVAEEWGLRITDSGDSPRTSKTLNDPFEGRGVLEQQVPGFLTRGGDGLVYANYGGGKTMFALGLSYCVACPAFPFDQDRQVETSRTGRTLWIGSDGGEEAEGMVRKYVEVIRAPGEGVWRSRFTFWGQSRERGEASWNFSVRGLHQMFQELADKENGDVPYRLVVIDTLKSVMDGGKIDYGIGPMGTCMRLMQAAAARFDLSVLWLHHTKSGRDKDGAMSGGNSNITQVPFSVIYLEHVKHRNYQHLTRCVVEKMRGESRREFLYTIDEECGLFKIVDEAEGLQGDLLYEVWVRRDYGAPITELVKTQDVAEKTVRNKCTAMAKEELIYSKKGKWWITAKGAKQLALDNMTLAGAVGEWLNTQPVSQARGGGKSGNSSKTTAVQGVLPNTDRESSGIGGN